jgi:hypothetical protein
MTACAAKFRSKLDLLIGKGPDLSAINAEKAEECFVPAQCNPYRGAGAEQVDQYPAAALADAIRGAVGDVGHLDEILPIDEPFKNRAGAKPQRLSKSLHRRRRSAAFGHEVKGFAVEAEKSAQIGLAQPDCPSQHRVEHRSQVARRGIDDAEHLGGRGLLLQGLAGLGDEPRVLDRDDRLRREVL